MSSGAIADEMDINLSPEQPYVDIPIEAPAQTQLTITTETGTPQTPGFIDSWIELWQDSTRLAFNDDGAHSAINYLASIISMPIEAGMYFIRATSFNYVASNGTQTPTGSYTLNWDGAVITSPSPTASVTPTPEPTPTPTETQSPEPTPTPSDEPSPTQTPTIEPTPQPTETPTPMPSETFTQPPTTPAQETPSSVQPIIIPTPAPSVLLNNQIDDPVEIIEQPSETEQELIEQTQSTELPTATTNEIPPVTEHIELTISPIFDNLPGAEQIIAAVESVINIGSDMTPEQREESQSVVIAAVLVTQIAQISTLAQSTRRIK